MKMDRIWAMPNSKTFTIKPIRELIARYTEGCGVIVDPFSKDCRIGTVTNDLNPECDADFHMDALEFLRTLDDESADCVLYDPPYSITQAAQCYKSYGKEKLEVSVSNMRYWASVKNECARILKKGGVALCFGWSSMGLGKNRGFRMEEVLLVPHGGSKNDTICTAEVKE